MTRIALRAAATGLALHSAPSTAIPFPGQMQRSDETFSGSFAGGGYRSGPGLPALASNRRVSCKGEDVFTSRRKCEGVLNCDDGRTGPVHLSGFDAPGSGYGDLSGQRFTVTFGRTS